MQNFHRTLPYIIGQKWIYHHIQEACSPQAGEPEVEEVIHANTLIVELKPLAKTMNEDSLTLWACTEETVDLALQAFRAKAYLAMQPC